MDVTKSKWCDFRYRGEGNTSMCFEIKDYGCVLNLLKSELDIEDSKPKDHLNERIRYHNNVVKQFFDPQYLPTEFHIVGPFSSSFITDLKNNTEYLRPTYRRTKGIPDEETYGLIMEDMCKFSGIQRPVLSVEIKPKFGSVEGSRRQCRHCQKQDIKLKSGRIDKKSLYCPSDLFSGEKTCTEFALNCLMNNPQNNFRIFLDGILMFGEGMVNDLQFLTEFEFIRKSNLVAKDALINMLVQVLSVNDDHLSIQPNAYCSSSMAYKNGMNVPSLNRSSCLGQLLSAQLLSKIDIKEAFFLFNSLCCDPTWLLTMQSKLLEGNKVHFSDEEKLIRDFLFSASSRDCSIMIAFVEERNDGKLTTKSKVKLIDLDPKPLSRISSFYAKWD